MDSLKRKRSNIKSALTRFSNYIGQSELIINVRELRKRLEKCELLFDQYNEVQSEIEELENEEDISLSDRESFENQYFQVISQAQQMIENNQQQTNQPSGSASHASGVNRDSRKGVKLPDLKLPTFDGALGNWLKFRDSFTSMIHENPNLDNVDKFNYLTSYVTGEASRCIEALGVSELNYELAWKKLKDRFEDSNELTNHHIRSLYALPKMTRRSFLELRRLIDDTNNHLLALNALGEKTEYWDRMIIHLFTLKLHESINCDWEHFLATKNEKILLKDMLKFLENHCKFLQNTNRDKAISSHDNYKSNNSKFENSKRNYAKTYAISTNQCVLCKNSHFLYACQEFKNLTPSDRVKKVFELNLCFNCLSKGHRNRECKLGPCRKCGKKHNSLLHVEKSPSDPQTSQETSEQSFSARTSHSYVLLATATVLLEDIYGNQHECRALLDSCSQPNIMTASFRKKLGLRQTRTDITLTGIGQEAQNVAFKTTTTLKSRTTDFSTSITCIILNKISGNLPEIGLHSISNNIPEKLKLADPYYYRSGPIDLLIGAGLFYQLLCVGQIKLKKDEPVLQKTLLGWIITGKVNFINKEKPNVVCNLVKNCELYAQLERFWKIENGFTETKVFNRKNFSEQHFTETTKQDHTGRFIISIPFKKEVLELGVSREMAFKRLISMERKFSKDKELKRQYVNFMEEYQNLGHMVELPSTECNDNITHFYLPHHAVMKEGSTTTKLRVVFDGSAKTTSGLSLNDVQHVTPPVQDELFSIILRFRLHRYVLSADITKMYRQILVTPEQRPLQRILWRKDDNLPIKTFELTTVTYGTASAPFLATRCLEEVGKRCKEEYSMTSKVIMNDFYVDDLLSGTETIETAIQMKNELQTILLSAGFELRKWASNEPQIIHEENNLHQEIILMHGDKDPKTLGLIWDPSMDVLKYKVNCSDTRKVTKRTILSVIAQIFDPLGLVGPAIVQAKIIMQKLWSLKLEWDESLPQELHTNWQNIYEQLLTINEIVINRSVMCPNYEQVEYHGFCDASEKAFGACVYIVSEKNGIKTSKLLCAKSRVAPLKATTIPRLELLGAVLLSQLAKKVSIACNLKMSKWTFWTDSMVVLAWIKSSTKWKSFVANRVVEIQDLTNENWNYVKSAENPADIISRGINANELKNLSLWWNGPVWLIQHKNQWPTYSEIQTTNIPEQKRVEINFLIKEVETERDLEETQDDREYKFEHFDRFSSFSRLIRCVAYVLRFIENCKGLKSSNNCKYVNSNLKPFELDRAIELLAKCAQRETYSKEFSTLKAGRSISKPSRLYQLNPFLDATALLRVGGRLSNASVPFNQKHQIILAPNHIFTKLLIKYEHERLLHAGCQAVLASLRQRFWPISAKNQIKKVLRECVICFRNKPTPTSYLMGNLPAPRVTPLRPFHTCGVDYAGPMLIKEKSRSRTAIKSYICIFVCFSTKAVHIELAHNLSTEAFLNCFKRFISRRGKCKTIYSDNGKNFIGAKNELSRIIKDNTFQTNVTNYLATENVDWKFIPPHAPHFGGLWESAVKSTKYHLKRVIGETRLTYEELYTLLTQIEACLNSRPLSPISNDPKDLSPLTPGHFLIGDALTALPQEDVRDINPNRLNRYQHLQKMFHHFWQRWHREYLSGLQGRQKWRSSSGDRIKPGMLVLIKEENIQPMQWPLGRIEEVHPGKDGVIRVVSVRVARGIVKRPLTKICVLPVSSDHESG